MENMNHTSFWQTLGGQGQSRGMGHPEWHVRHCFNHSGMTCAWAGAASAKDWSASIFTGTSLAQGWPKDSNGRWLYHTLTFTWWKGGSWLGTQSSCLGIGASTEGMEGQFLQTAESRRQGTYCPSCMHQMVQVIKVLHLDQRERRPNESRGH